MAHITVRFHPAASLRLPGTIYYQIGHKRRTRRIKTSYRLTAEEWDSVCGTRTDARASPAGCKPHPVQAAIADDTERIARIIRAYRLKGVEYSVDNIANDFESYIRKGTLFRFMSTLIASFRAASKIRICETYTATLNSFRRFRSDKDIALDDIRSELIEEYQAYLKASGLVPNTVSFYMRVLRAAYNRAVEQGLTDQHSPFRHVYTGVDKTIKRALPLKTIRKLKELDISLVPDVDYARDMFMLSFYLRGMSFVDMAYLRKDDLRHGYITYRRRKTGQALTIAWTEEMQLILDKYPRNPTAYLLPILNRPAVNEHYCYRNTGYAINRNLKKLAELAGIDEPLSMYYARHSWASAAKSKGIPVSVISECMGHGSETTTRIYLASLDNSIIDNANKLILSSL